MKYLFFIFLLPMMTTEASVVFKLENKKDSYAISIWKHTEGLNDSVNTFNVFKNQYKGLSLLDSQKELVAIFNKGVFTSMKYLEGSTKRWATLSNAEKDTIFYIQNNFDITEK